MHPENKSFERWLLENFSAEEQDKNFVKRLREKKEICAFFIFKKESSAQSFAEKFNPHALIMYCWVHEGWGVPVSPETEAQLRALYKKNIRYTAEWINPAIEIVNSCLKEISTHEHKSHLDRVYGLASGTNKQVWHCRYATKSVMLFIKSYLALYQEQMDSEKIAILDDFIKNTGPSLIEDNAWFLANREKEPSVFDDAISRRTELLLDGGVYQSSEDGTQKKTPRFFPKDGEQETNRIFLQTGYLSHRTVTEIYTEARDASDQSILNGSAPTHHLAFYVTEYNAGDHSRFVTISSTNIPVRWVKHSFEVKSDFEPGSAEDLNVIREKIEKIIHTKRKSRLLETPEMDYFLAQMSKEKSRFGFEQEPLACTIESILVYLNIPDLLFKMQIYTADKLSEALRLRLQELTLHQAHFSELKNFKTVDLKMHESAQKSRKNTYRDTDILHAFLSKTQESAQRGLSSAHTEEELRIIFDLSKKADLRAKTSKGERPLQIASALHMQSLVDFILEADPSQALHYYLANSPEALGQKIAGYTLERQKEYIHGAILIAINDKDPAFIDWLHMNGHRDAIFSFTINAAEKKEPGHLAFLLSDLHKETLLEALDYFTRKSFGDFAGKTSAINCFPPALMRTYAETNLIPNIEKKGEDYRYFLPTSLLSIYYKLLRYILKNNPSEINLQDMFLRDGILLLKHAIERLDFTMIEILLLTPDAEDCLEKQLADISKGREIYQFKDFLIKHHRFIPIVNQSVLKVIDGGLKASALHPFQALYAAFYLNIPDDPDIKRVHDGIIAKQNEATERSEYFRQKRSHG